MLDFSGFTLCLALSSGFPGGSDGKESGKETVKSPMQESGVQSLGREDPPEKGMEAHSSVLAWSIPWTEKPGGLPSMGSQSRTRLSD